MRLQKHRQLGFTLIELVMVMVIMGILSVMVGKILLQSYQLFSTSQNIAEIDWQAFLALARMTDDIHNIRSAADISTASSTQLAFTDVNANSITYQFSSSSLLRNSQTLASGIQSFSLSYLDKNGASTSTASLVRYVSISASFTQGNQTQSFSTVAATRGMS